MIIMKKELFFPFPRDVCLFKGYKQLMLKIRRVNQKLALDGFKLTCMKADVSINFFIKRMK
jgi:hypothetical protein